MKKFLLGLTASVFFLPNVSGQTNNPYNQLGADVVSAAQVIYKDYVNGKLKEIDQKTLDHYFETLLPNYTTVKINDFNQILTALKGTNNASIIKNSKYSEEGKTFLQKSLESYSITKLVEEVKKSKIDESEKQGILSVLAINYNLIKPYIVDKQTPTGKGCYEVSDVDFSNTLGTKSMGINTFVWGGIGYVMGSVFCVPCGVVAGIGGLVLGGWMDDRGIKPTISSGSGSGGMGSGGWSPQP